MHIRTYGCKNNPPFSGSDILWFLLITRTSLPTVMLLYNIFLNVVVGIGLTYYWIVSKPRKLGLFLIFGGGMFQGRSCFWSVWSWFLIDILWNVDWSVIIGIYNTVFQHDILPYLLWERVILFLTCLVHELIYFKNYRYEPSWNGLISVVSFLWPGVSFFRDNGSFILLISTVDD